MNNRRAFGWRDAIIFASILLAFAILLLVAIIFSSYAGSLESGLGAEFRFPGYSLVNTETSPQWSADGSVIVANNFGSIYGVSADGSKLWRIATAGAGREGRQYLMSSVDSHARVGYIMYHYDDDGVGWFVDDKPHKISRETIGIEGADIERVTESSFENAPQLVASQDWSPDGSRIAYNDEIAIQPDLSNLGPSGQPKRSWGWQNILAVMSNDGSSVIQFPKSLFSEKSIMPVWSKDGRKIAFSRHEVRYPYFIQSLVTANWDGTDAKTALEVKSSLQGILQESLEWSTSNNLIYFIKNEWMDEIREEIASSSLMSVRLDGSDERVIIRQLDGVGRDVKASPDGKRLLVTTSTGIHVVSTDGVDIRKIYEPQDIDESTNTATYRGFSAAWSPDGNRIAVQLHAEHRLLIFTISPDGADARRLTKRNKDGLLVPGLGEPLPEALVDPVQ